MKLINSSVEIIPQDIGLEGIYKQCELAGRTAYKSTDKITEGSAKRFVDAMIKNNHGAVLEHGTIYLKVSHTSPAADEWYMEKMRVVNFYAKNKYSKYKRVTEDHFHVDNYITTNLRVLFENDRMDDLQYLCEPTELHEKRITARFVCSRSIAQEITRHRVFSFLMESQRYVAYNKDKFGKEITYIIPEWVKNRVYEYADSIEPMTGYKRDYLMDMSLIEAITKHMPALDRACCCWYEALEKCEEDYMYLITTEELKAEEARGILPNDCKTELIMTGFVSDYNHFFDLRAYGKTGKPHPDIKILADGLLVQFVQNNLI